MFLTRLSFLSFHPSIIIMQLKMLDRFHSYLIGLFVVTGKCAYLTAILIQQKLLELLDLELSMSKMGYLSALIRP